MSKILEIPKIKVELRNWLGVRVDPFLFERDNGGGFTILMISRCSIIDVSVVAT